MADQPSVSAVNHYKCSNCGADLTYAPGTKNLKCEYCSTEMVISESETTAGIEETDFTKFLSENDLSEDQKCQVHTINCKNCGATTTLAESRTSDNCAFCGTPIVVQNAQTSTLVKPRYLLPFGIAQNAALLAYRSWLKKLWFAPTRLKRFGSTSDKLTGVYIPYWTYDSQTETDYRGERGTDYTESYTVTVNGKSERRTRTVTRWSPVHGRVNCSFDDILVLGSTSLPKKYADKLEPWDLQNLVEYEDKYLSGFRSESYQVSVLKGFDTAKEVMDNGIRTEIRRDIGGDHQRISSMSSNYDAVTFKHILLPIWISAYRFQNKVYRFMINGRTGEVQGERPWSWVKITLASLAVAGAIALGYYGYTVWGG